MNSTQLATRPTNGGPMAVRPSALNAMAARLNVEPEKLLDTLKSTAFKGASNAEMLALVVVANQYGLNPFLKQIYAFPAKGGGIVPVVGIDGWTTLVNANPNFDGVEFEYADGADGKPMSVTCVMHVKNRSHPVKVTEYYSECKRASEPWNTMPRRMLRHKAFIQCGRVAFSLGGIYEEEEAQQFTDVQATIVTDQPERHEPRASSLAKRLASAPPDDGTTGKTPPPDGQANGHADVGETQPQQTEHGGEDHGQADAEPRQQSETQPPASRITDAMCATYAAFNDAFVDRVATVWTSAEFQACMNAVALAYKVRAEGLAGCRDRRLVLQALDDGRLGKDGKILS